MTEAWALVEVGVVASQGSLTEGGDLTKTRQTQQSPGKYESQYRAWPWFASLSPLGFNISVLPSYRKLISSSGDVQTYQEADET